MGYRHYFYLIEKEKAEALSNMKKEEFEKTYFKKEEADEVDCFPMEILWKLIGENKFWEFGKYYENEKGIHSCGLKLFKDEYISNFFGDANPYLCGPDAVLNAINWLKDEFVSYMRDCLMSDEEFEKAHGYKSTKKNRQEVFIRDMLKEWDDDSLSDFPQKFQDEFRCQALDTNLKNPEITKSWRYDYEAFELTRLYKTTDWNKYNLVFLGW